MGNICEMSKSTAHPQRFLPYKKARALVRSLNLKSKADWRKFRKGELIGKGKRLKSIPSNPDLTYRDKGWVSWGEWLGTKEVSTKNRVFRPFEEARAYIHSLKLKNEQEWRSYSKGELSGKKRPDNIPSNPDIAYAEKGWKGYGNWLGTNRISNKHRVHRPYEEAREFVRSLHLKSAREWLMFTKGQMPNKGLLPLDVPKNPRGAYLNKGWKGFGDWIGTGAIAPRLRKFRSFQDARTFVHSLKLKNQDEWRKFCKGQMPEKGAFPADLPTNPHHTYAKTGWVNTADWIGR